ncbi:MAG: chemotaxis protein CheR [Oceanicaulis sp.]|jgi:chemotaxis protein methyltransferase CheR|uniref:CheR family methyltransferase n=1 Tax=unclassified Oceanicaulis TaxID=2632123 RepID=UPI000C4B722D|nr:MULTISPECIES: protein-glutamate O-methyltransferase CheR [unclassified Oceanicaulis]MAB70031.1 chemotaxis protein CheR [Oceanicaulis sp.]MBC38027.1 chemotaxis protein CheR [Oceanicaulis sp.]MBG36680.1 chemotaxis protein CheR [Oceanicaulis sp.]HBU61652.1 chemotaxis protein CheR [Oceanicaulis sp.]|tara:strand:- start:9287 stop:10117 length:831 start_codon:yes stop_codon:yes gene_type:complete
MSALPSNKFDFLCQDVRKRSGLVLGQEKAYLIDSRLGPLARKEGFASVEALIDAMMRGDQRICVAASEALATHETFFFRDKTPFDLFENVIAPALKTARMGRQLKIWCAAASSGQEPYSLGMLLDEIPGLSADILATDMSAPVLEKAKAGIYTQFEVQRGLPIQRLVKHFDQVGDSWRIKPQLRQKVRFEQANLLDDFARFGKMDVIFCRNVLIYFDIQTKAKVLDRLAAQLADDGFLLLGAAETVVGLTDSLRPISGHRGLYAKPAMAAKLASAA